jgi:membrane associated rhomboid family serine protease
MGLYDRDYARERRPGFPSASSLSMTTRLLIVNVGLWFVFAGAFRTSHGRGGFYRFLEETFLLHTDAVFAKLRLWQPFTAMWFHDPGGLGHLFFNMLFLFFFGRVVEQLLGPRGMLRLYIAGGLASTFAMIPLAWIQATPIVGLGASGAIYAIGVYAALRMPNLPVILIIVPMPLWVMVGVFMVGREVANLVLVGASVGSSVGHLAGALAGWLYHRRRRQGGPGAGADLIAAMRRKVETTARRRDSGDEERDRRRVDALLAKIHDEGIQALSEEEKDFLQRASRRFGGR